MITKVFIGKNIRYGNGYQVRVAFDNCMDEVIDYRAYTLKQAVFMAGNAAEVNQRGGEEIGLRDVLTIISGRLSGIVLATGCIIKQRLTSSFSR